MEPIGVKVDIAVAPDLTADPSTWDYEDASADWYASADIELQVGADDEQPVGQSSLGLALRNGASRTAGPGAGIVGRYTEDNPLSDLWPLFTLGAGLRWSLDWGAGYEVQAVQSVARLEYGYANDTERGTRLPLCLVQGAGPMQRLQAGSTKASPLRRAVLGMSPAPLAWWSLEHGDDRETLTVPSDLVGGISLVAEPATAGVHRASGVIGGAVTGPLGADKAINTAAGGQLSSPLPAAVPGEPWRYELGVQIGHEIGELDSGQLFRIVTPAGVIGLFAGVVPTAEFAINFVGDTLVSDEVSSILDDGAWHWVSLTCSTSGGGADTAYSVKVDGQVVLSGTATGYPFQPPIDHVLSPTGDMDGLSHAVYSSAASLPAEDLYEASIAYAGELAHVRFGRLCTQDSVPHEVTATDSTPMGPQPVDALVPLLRDVERTDRGIIDDHLGVLKYLSITELYNPTPVLELDGSNEEIFAPYLPVVDDQRARNDTTAKRPGGGAARVQVPAAAHYSGDIYPNAATDDTLPNHASWRNHEGEIRARHPAVTVHLHTRPDLATATMAVGLGDVTRVVNPPRGHAPLPKDLQVRGYRMRLRGTRGLWIWQANTISAEPYEVWQVETGTGNRSRIPAGLSTLDSAYSSAATSLSVTSASTRWIDSATYPSQFPIIIVIAGEPMTCTAITGTGLTQTFTVTRGLHGWSKPLPDESVVQLWRPPAIALRRRS